MSRRFAKSRLCPATRVGLICSKGLMSHDRAFANALGGARQEVISFYRPAPAEIPRVSENEVRALSHPSRRPGGDELSMDLSERTTFNGIDRTHRRPALSGIQQEQTERSRQNVIMKWRQGFRHHNSEGDDLAKVAGAVDAIRNAEIARERRLIGLCDHWRRHVSNVGEEAGRRAETNHSKARNVCEKLQMRGIPVTTQRDGLDRSQS